MILHEEIRVEHIVRYRGLEMSMFTCDNSLTLSDEKVLDVVASLIQTELDSLKNKIKELDEEIIILKEK